MAIDIRSQEFANSWRVVSEGLLAAIQKGLLSVDIPVEAGSSKQDPKIDNDPVTKENIIGGSTTVAKKEESRSYASMPVKKLNDGTYEFKNLKEEMQPGSTYLVIRYSDGTAEFELCDMEGENRQIFKDNQAERMPSAVGKCVGEITADSRIKTTRRGKGLVQGRKVLITEPLEVEFIS